MTDVVAASVAVKIPRKFPPMIMNGVSSPQKLSRNVLATLSEAPASFFSYPLFFAWK